MRRRMTSLLVVLAAAGVGMISTVVMANVYPSGVIIDPSMLGNTCGTLKVSYILNENANGDGTRPGLKIEVLDGNSNPVRTISIATLAKGKYSWEWDGRKDDGTMAPNGNYTVKITAADIGHSSWTQISDLDTAHNFYYPRSVDINRNPASPHYGKIYVAEAEGGLTGNGRTTQDGVYALTADGSEAHFSNAVDPTASQSPPPRAGVMLNWTDDSTGRTKPYKLNVCSDDHVYVSSKWDDMNFDFMPDLSAVTQVNYPDNLQGYDVSPYQYACCSYATGSQTAGNRVLYLLNDNYSSTGPNYRGIIKYVLGANAATTVDDKGAYALALRPTYYGRDMTIDSAGNMYLNNYRSKENEAQAIDKYDSAGTKIATFVTPKNVLDSEGIGISEVKGWAAAVSANNGNVYIFDINTGAQLQTVAAEASAIRDVAFDTAGNMYTVCNAAEWLRAWSPPDGPNHKDYTTAVINLNKSGSGGPTITTQPQNAIFCVNGSASFTVVANGSNVTYKWQKNGVDLTDGTNVSGSSTNSLTLSNVPASDNGALITVRVCDDNGVVMSNMAKMTIGVSILQQPAGVTTCQNTDATFSILATGKGALSYNWQMDTAGDGIFSDFNPPATGTSATITNVQTSLNNTQVRCVVTDECGPVTSAVAQLRVLGNPSGLSVYFPVTAAAGGNAHFYSQANGTGVLHHQWYKTVKGVKTPIGTDNGTLDYTAEQCDNWYENGALQLAVISVKVTDDCGNAETDSNNTVNPPVLCTLTVSPGGPVQQNTKELCSDGLDNACNGLIDCADTDCQNGGFCCPAPWADSDDDKDVDQVDFGSFQLCYTGAGDPELKFDADNCFCYDRDKDNDVDATDFDAFSNCWSGPTILQTTPGCQ